jgi:hypothetical protein
VAVVFFYQKNIDMRLRTAWQLSEKDYRFNNWQLFTALSAVYVLLMYYANHFIVSDQLFYHSLGNDMSIDKIDALLSNQKKYAWASYAIMPLLLLLKVSLTAVCLSLGGFVTNMETPYKKMFKIALFAELALLLGSVVQGLCLQLFTHIETLEDIQTFAPFSLYGLFDPHRVPVYLNYPLRVLNVFEIGYWLLLALGLRALLGKPFGKMLGFVLGSYGTGLLIWVIVIVFFTLNASA